MTHLTMEKLHATVAMMEEAAKKCGWCDNTASYTFLWRGIFDCQSCPEHKHKVIERKEYLESLYNSTVQS